VSVTCVTGLQKDNAYSVPAKPVSSGSACRMQPVETLDLRWYRLLLGRAAEQIYARNSILWKEGDATEGLFLLDSGALRLTRETGDSHANVLGEESGPAAILTPGVFDGGPNCTSARAVTDCFVRLLPRPELLDLCHENPDLLLKMAAALSCRDRRTAEFIDLVTVASVRQRVAHLLLDLMRQNGTQHLELPYSHSTLAQGLGTVREVLFRSLKQLQSEGVLHFRGSDIIVENARALREAAGISDRPVFTRYATSPTPRYLALVVGPR
jgi:CRP-like cAMP-binding protein